MEQLSFLPRKRRKTGRDCSADKNVRLATTSTVGMSSVPRRPATRSMTRVGWKSGAIPVELFEHIISYLPRKDIQNMRFVNHEFEEKVSKHLFKTVVVPFKPEIYEISDDVSYSFTTKKKKAQQASASPEKSGAVILQDKGMRVFQGFGRHISRFAMSFEFDPATLTAPPLKCDQEAITSFWGIFRWPHKTYNRYTQLEGLEQTADETRTLAQALTYISNAKELALSVDSGLGWLSGPDVNPKMDDIDHNRVVFGESRFVPEPKRRLKQRSSSLRPSRRAKFGNLVIPELDVQQQKVYERMLEEAGYTGSHLKYAIILLAQHDGILNPFRELPGLKVLREAVSPIGEEEEDVLVEVDSSSSTSNHSSPNYSSENDTAMSPRLLEKPLRPKAEAVSDPPLKPADLTTAQKEMLLEIEWAQRAFVQSYAIAVIDNRGTFLNVRSLTFARIPSRHIRIISRTDFWHSLPNLAEVSLAVIPDWREIIKLPTTYVHDVQLKPSCALPEVHLLIEDYIAPRKSIKSFHFEWLCGGEEAPGVFARDQLILPAPVVEGPMEMVDLINQPSLLNFPHVEHLSFKNCWFSPHMLISLVTSHENAELKSLSLNSVSLSAPSTLSRHHPQQLQATHHPIAAQPAAPNLVQLGGLFQQNPVANPPPAVGAQAIANAAVQTGAGNLVPTAVQGGRRRLWLDYLDAPRKYSWADVIDNITPGQNIAEARYAYDDRNPVPPKRRPSKLQKINFQSCGYLRVAIDLDHSVFDGQPFRPSNGNCSFSKKRAELDGFMMKKIDSSLGTIIPWMDNQEMATLQQGFFLSLGWDTSKADHEKFCAQYRVDVPADAVPGEGRFFGVLQGNIPDVVSTHELTWR